MSFPSEDPKKIAIAGNLILDVIKRIDVLPARGMLATVTDLSYAPGGLVANTGVDLVRLGDIRLTAFAATGDDQQADIVTAYLEKNGIDTRHIRRHKDVPTSATDVFTDSTGERTMFHCYGASSVFGPDDIDYKSLDCDLFLLGYLLLMPGLDRDDSEYGTVAARILHDVQAAGFPTCIDCVSAEAGRFTHIVRPALRYCDYAVINETEAGLVTGIAPRDAQGRIQKEAMERMCRSLISLGVRRAAVIHCPECSAAMDAATGEYELLPSLRLPKEYIKGAVGAGDAFCAGTLWGIVHGLSLHDSMRLASCSAAASLSVLDATSGAGSYEETMKLEKRFGRLDINSL